MNYNAAAVWWALDTRREELERARLDLCIARNRTPRNFGNALTRQRYESGKMAPANHPNRIVNIQRGWK